MVMLLGVRLLRDHVRMAAGAFGVFLSVAKFHCVVGVMASCGI